MKWIALLIVFLYVLFISIPFLNDVDLGWEWIILSAAQGIVRTGLPEISQSVGLHKFGISDNEILIVHAPVMPYLIAFSINIFGNNIASARLPGLLFILLTSFIVYKISKICKQPELYSSIIVVIFITNPFVLQGYLCIDSADSALSPLLTCLFIYLFLALNNNSIMNSVLLGFVLSLLFLSKFSNGIIMLISLIIVYVLNIKGFKLKSLLIISCSFALFFIIIWLSYCVYIHILRCDLPIDELILCPFNYMFSDSSVIGFWKFPDPIASILLNVLYFVIYAGPVFIIIGVLAIAAWSYNKLKNIKTMPDDIIPVFCIGILLAYSIYLGGMGPFKKYYFPCMPLLPIIFFRHINIYNININFKEFRLYVLLFIYLLSYYFFVAGDNMYVLSHEIRKLRYLDDNRLGLYIFILNSILYFIPFLPVIILYNKLVVQVIFRTFFFQVFDLLFSFLRA